MKLKLTRAELVGIELLLIATMSAAIPNDFIEKMLNSIIKEFYERIVPKLIKNKPSFSLTLSHAEAFCLVMISNALPEVTEEMIFETNLLLKLTNQIKQHYA